MQLKNICLPLLVILLFGIIVCHAGTFKPFVRSRYSLRWRKTTETPKLWDSTTSSPKIEVAATSNTVEDIKKLVETSTAAIIGGGTVKTSTHSPDYDYYGNNEIEDNDRAQNVST
ncbi:uncharacterized protein LOC105261549 [Musca domestica]|uniref:Uncharacterized protein LOC105261549 n=1 Tax=Musca domestica TaxID=7370 RepID=A0A1I8NJA5_MUSDO|nr:uncharacterized protein LOC105261549 [Musca domestica]